MARVPVMCLMTGACLGLTPIFPKVSGCTWPTVSALACCERREIRENVVVKLEAGSDLMWFGMLYNE